MAVGNGTSSRLFAISVGYAIDALLLAIYLNVLPVGSVRSASRAIRNAVRQQLLVVKVRLFEHLRISVLMRDSRSLDSLLSSS